MYIPEKKTPQPFQLLTRTASGRYHIWAWAKANGTIGKGFHPRPKYCTEACDGSGLEMMWSNFNVLVVPW